MSEEELDETTEETMEETKETVIEEEIVDYEEKYIRLLAELENTRKRMQKEKQECVRFAIENSISEILPIMDNFENALNFAKDSSTEIKNWALGFHMILTQFKDILHNHGIVAFHSEGNQFNPHLHEAVEVEETEEHPEGMILKEFAKGYKSQSRTIRPAKVKVSKKTVEQTTAKEDAEEKATN